VDRAHQRGREHNGGVLVDAHLNQALQVAQLELEGRTTLTLRQSVPRFGIVEVIGVVGTVLIVYRPGPSTLRHNAVLVASHAIGVVE
jgi:hypothetical protein